jgi:hypothetical protein
VPVGFCGWIFTVQAPTKYKLAITMKTAKALRITVPPRRLTGRFQRDQRPMLAPEEATRPRFRSSQGITAIGRTNSSVQHKAAT